MTCIFESLCKLQFRSHEYILNMFLLYFDQFDKLKTFSKHFGMLKRIIFTLKDSIITVLEGGIEISSNFMVDGVVLTLSQQDVEK